MFPLHASKMNLNPCFYLPTQEASSLSTATSRSSNCCIIPPPVIENLGFILTQTNSSLVNKASPFQTQKPLFYLPTQASSTISLLLSTSNDSLETFLCRTGRKTKNSHHFSSSSSTSSSSIAPPSPFYYNLQLTMR